MGWHQVQARSPDRSDTAALVITPAYLGVPDQLGRLWGLAVQLYAVRSHRSWGLGDAADLADLAGWSGRELGAGFVLVNPLHAADPIAPMEPSPYLPSSRRFLNPMYIRVEEVPEFGYLSLDDRTAIEQLARPCRSRNGTDDLLDRDAIWAAKKAALELVFAVSRSPGRQAAYVAFREEHGEGLVDFATWCALAERHGLPWRAWPEELRDARSHGAGGRPCGAGRAGGLLRLAPVGRRRSAGGARGRGPVCRHAARCRPRFGRRRVHEGQTRGRCSTFSRPASRSAHPATPSTSRARTGGSRPGIRSASPRRATSRTATWSGPSCVTPADCASTTWSDCSACGGFRRVCSGGRNICAVRP